MIFTGRFVGAEEALAIGLVDEVVARRGLQRRLAWAGQFAGARRRSRSPQPRPPSTTRLDTDLSTGLAIEGAVVRGLLPPRTARSAWNPSSRTAPGRQSSPAARMTGHGVPTSTRRHDDHAIPRGDPTLPTRTPPRSRSRPLEDTAHAQVLYHDWGGRDPRRQVVDLLRRALRIDYAWALRCGRPDATLLQADRPELGLRHRLLPAEPDAVGVAKKGRSPTCRQGMVKVALRKRGEPRPTSTAVSPTRRRFPTRTTFDPSSGTPSRTIPDVELSLREVLRSNPVRALRVRRVVVDDRRLLRAGSPRHLVRDDQRPRSRR